MTVTRGSVQAMRERWALLDYVKLACQDFTLKFEINNQMCSEGNILATHFNMVHAFPSLVLELLAVRTPGLAGHDSQINKWRSTMEEVKFNIEYN